MTSEVTQRGFYASYLLAPGICGRPGMPGWWSAGFPLSWRGFAFRLRLFLLLDDFVAAQANLVKHVVVDDKIPVAETQIQILDVLLALFQQRLILIELVLVFRFDSLSARR